jgi:hypothetical protein
VTPNGTATVSHVCLNDDVVEGLELRDDDGRLLSFSVQYHPEAAAGPHDAAYLFDRFTDLMAGSASASLPGTGAPAKPSGASRLPPDPSTAAAPAPVRPAAAGGHQTTEVSPAEGDR